jgi:hypothetical protein
MLVMAPWDARHHAAALIAVTLDWPMIMLD